MPLAEIKQMMIADRIDPRLIDMNGNDPPPADIRIPIKYDPTLAPYKRTLENGSSIARVREKLIIDGIHPAVLDVDVNEPVPTAIAPSQPKVKDDPRLAKYFSILMNEKQTSDLEVGMEGNDSDGERGRR